MWVFFVVAEAFERASMLDYRSCDTWVCSVGHIPLCTRVPNLDVSSSYSSMYPGTPKSAFYPTKGALRITGPLALWRFGFSS